MTEPILSVRNLRISFDTPTGKLDAVRGISFDLGHERLGIVGESGSGKSQTGRSILRLLPENATVTADRMQFEGRDLLDLNSKEMNQIRGKSITMIMQDPKYSLNPVIRVGDQIAEVFIARLGLSKSQARANALEWLEKTKIRNPEQVFNQYPHELSGGMGQRVMIAMMLSCDPRILIADEPTSALDVAVQLQVLLLLDNLVSERKTGLIFISHDLELVATFCDRILVMYAGQIMEVLNAKNLSEAKHPYTRGLQACRPDPASNHEDIPVLSRDPAWLEEKVKTI